jgi:hypothetical protein
MKRPVLWFLLLNLGLGVAVFREAMWGQALLAPLDLPPAAYAKYHFVDPLSNGLVKNSGLVDQLLYDLPIQYTVHDAYRRGEIPWWDPYSYAGRPFWRMRTLTGLILSGF